MRERDIEKSDPGAMAQLMDVNADMEAIWHMEELAAVLRHQLAASLSLDLSEVDPSVPKKLTELRKRTGVDIKCFSELLHHIDPPLDLLLAVKDFAKGHRFAAASPLHPDAPLPREVATLIYFLSIFVALLRKQRRISRLSHKAMVDATDWALEQRWVDPRTRAVFIEARDHLRDKGEANVMRYAKA